MNIAERLNEFHSSYLKTKGYGGRNVLEIELGKKPGYLTTAAKRNTTIGSDVIEIVVRKFNELDITWLITGEGQMLKEASSSPPANENESVYEKLFREKEAQVAAKEKRIEELIAHNAKLEQELSVFITKKTDVPEAESVSDAAEILKPTGTGDL